jgi:hypothetical protein
VSRRFAPPAPRAAFRPDEPNRGADALARPACARPARIGPIPHVRFRMSGRWDVCIRAQRWQRSAGFALILLAPAQTAHFSSPWPRASILRSGGSRRAVGCRALRPRSRSALVHLDVSAESGYRSHSIDSNWMSVRVRAARSRARRSRGVLFVFSCQFGDNSIRPAGFRLGSLPFFRAAPAGCFGKGKHRGHAPVLRVSNVWITGARSEGTKGTRAERQTADSILEITTPPVFP